MALLGYDQVRAAHNPRSTLAARSHGAGGQSPSTSTGRSTSSLVPWPGGLWTVMFPPSACTRSVSPTTRAPPGSAPPTPSSPTVSCRRPSAGRSDLGERGAGVLGGVGQRLRGHVVYGDLHRRRSRDAR